MPSAIGSSLQDAQNQLQALTGDEIFYTASHDDSGAGRLQVIDANWKVCSQNIRAGTSITKDSRTTSAR
jgi:hypothetical protein